jgi:hypothetical protein
MSIRETDGVGEVAVAGVQLISGSTRYRLGAWLKLFELH